MPKLSSALVQSSGQCNDNSNMALDNTQSVNNIPQTIVYHHSLAGCGRAAELW